MKKLTTIELLSLDSGKMIETGPKTAARILARHPEHYVKPTEEAAFRYHADQLAAQHQLPLQDIAAELIDTVI